MNKVYENMEDLFTDIEVENMVSEGSPIEPTDDDGQAEPPDLPEEVDD